MSSSYLKVFVTRELPEAVDAPAQAAPAVRVQVRADILEVVADEVAAAVFGGCADVHAILRS